MGMRTKLEFSAEVGHDGSLNDLDWEDDISMLFDTLDRSESGVLTLAPNEQNVVVPFGDVAAGRFVYFSGDAEFEIALTGVLALAAQRDGAGGGFAGLNGLTLNLTTDTPGTAVNTTFQTGDTITQVVNRINAAAALVGMAPIAFNNAGQLRLKSSITGPTSKIIVETSSTALAALGHTAGTSTGTAAGGAAANVVVHRPASPAAATGLRAVFIATAVCSAALLFNPSGSNTVRIRYCVVGDLVET